MKQIDITKDKIPRQKVVLALGYFDCVHLGHRAEIKESKALCKLYNAKAVAMTFADCSFSQIVKKQKSLYTYQQRLQLFDDLGVDFVLPFLFEQVCDYSAEQFLSLLFDSLNIKAVVCGYDFRFGQKGKGDVQLLDSFCNKYNAELSLVSSELCQGVRVSTTKIRQLLSECNFQKANAMLGQEYFVCGQVVRGREVGRTNGQPTANILIDENYYCLPQGVYGTMVTIGKNATSNDIDNNKIYKAITNIGGKPTYGIETESIETLLIDFDDNIYDKTIDIKFLKKIRDTKKFDSVQDLIRQIEQDKNWQID